MNALAPDESHDDAQSSEESSSGRYLTPDEYAGDDHKALLDEEIQEALREADDLKAEGTEFFRTGMWAQALQAYRRGLARLPPRKRAPRAENLKGKAKADPNMRVGSDGSLEDGDNEEQKDPSEAEPLSKMEHDCAKGEHKEAVEACSQALLDDPHYIKVLHRRAMSNDILGTWSSLASAEEDYNKLLKVLPPSSPLLPQIQQALYRVTPRREAAQKAEMGEMVDKLKGLGNSILGNFGLSTDNFKFEPNGQGGYSVNFAR